MDGGGSSTVLSSAGHGLDGQMHIRDHQHLTGSLEWAALGPGHDGPCLVDVDGRAGPLHDDQIRVGSGQRPPARVAVPAPAHRTEQRRGQTSGPGPLARPRRPVEQIRVHRPARRRHQLGHRPGLAHHLGEQGGHGHRGGIDHLRPAGIGRGSTVIHPEPRPPSGPVPTTSRTPDQTADATSASEPVPSTTTQGVTASAASDR